MLTNSQVGAPRARRLRLKSHYVCGFAGKLGIGADASTPAAFEAEVMVPQDAPDLMLGNEPPEPGAVRSYHDAPSSGGLRCSDRLPYEAVFWRRGLAAPQENRKPNQFGKASSKTSYCGWQA